MRVFCLLLFGGLNLCVGLLWGQRYEVLPLEEMVNSGDYDEMSPVINRRGDRLYFTRMGSPDFDRTLIEDTLRLHETLSEGEYRRYLRDIYQQLAGKPVSNPVSSPFNQDIWFADLKDSSRIESVYHPGFPLNNALPNSVAALSPFSDELILINQFPREGGMRKGYSLSRKLGDTAWAYPEPLEIRHYYNSGTDVNLTMSIDGSLLLFAMEGRDSRGGADLYVSFRQGEHQWSEPVNLGDDINTAHDEVTPWLSDDMRSLYFSSDRSTGKGGRDIYLCYRKGDGWQDWEPARALVSPINTPSDDTQPAFNPHTGQLFFTSNRQGSLDIFRVQLAPPNPITVRVVGRVYHARTLEPLGATIQVRPKEERNYQGRTGFYTEDGRFELDIIKGMSMEVRAAKTGYQPTSETFFFKNGYFYSKTYEIQLFLEPLEEGMQVELDTLYFVQSEPELLERSFGALDELATFLLENPQVHIRLEGHTDNVGRPEELQRLSEQRAQSVADYLTSEHGIAPDRLDAKGYGARKPRNDNSTEALRAQNRRVEVIISKI